MNGPRTSSAQESSKDLEFIEGMLKDCLYPSHSKLLLVRVTPEGRNFRQSAEQTSKKVYPPHWGSHLALLLQNSKNLCGW